MSEPFISIDTNTNSIYRPITAPAYTNITEFNEEPVGIKTTLVLALPFDENTSFTDIAPAMRVDRTIPNKIITNNNSVGISSTIGVQLGRSSAYFDGTNQYLTTANSTSDFSFGTGNFTIEFWINSTQTTRTDPVGWNYNYGSAGWAGFIFNISSSGDMAWFENTSSRISASSTGWNNGYWNHVSVTRSGNSVRMFLNGSQVGSTYTTSFTYGAANSGFIIGKIFTDPIYLNGYISNLRIVKGTALYTEDFTPPRSLLTAVANTSLLTCQKGSITDASSNNFAITVNGDARPVYGFPSFKFDGVNDYATIPSSTLELDTNTNFTLEYWVYTSTSGLAPSVTVNAGTSKIIAFFINDVSFSTFYTLLSESNYPGSGNSDALRATTNISTNTWTHVSIVRLSGTITIYMNGVASGSVSNSYSSRPLNLIGAIAQGGAPNFYFFSGYISNTRVYKGKGLTAEEVEQNYNALKGRFGL